MSRPPYPGPKPVGPLKIQTQQPVQVSHYSTRLPRPMEMAPPGLHVGLQKTNGNKKLGVEGTEGDREEGEVSDVEMENGTSVGKLDLQVDYRMNVKNRDNESSNGKLKDKPYKVLAGSVDPRKGASGHRYHFTESSLPRVTAAKALTARISALNLSEQSLYVLLVSPTFRI